VVPIAPPPHPEAKTLVSTIAITDKEQEKGNLEYRSRREEGGAISYPFRPGKTRKSRNATSGLLGTG
jgi:hypothetical protein